MTRAYIPQVRRPVLDPKACWILVNHPTRGGGKPHVSQCGQVARPGKHTCIWHAKWEALTCDG